MPSSQYKIVPRNSSPPYHEIRYRDKYVGMYYEATDTIEFIKEELTLHQIQTIIYTVRRYYPKD